MALRFEHREVSLIHASLWQYVDSLPACTTASKLRGSAKMVAGGMRSCANVQVGGTEEWEVLHYSLAVASSNPFPPPPPPRFKDLQWKGDAVLH